MMLLLAAISIAYAQSPIPRVDLGFNTSISMTTIIEVDEGGDAMIQTRTEMSASGEFNEALRRQLEKMDNEESMARMAKQVEAALILLGYDVSSVELERDGNAVSHRIGISGFATRLGDTWIIKPEVPGLESLGAVSTAVFTDYFVVQNVTIRLPKGAEVLQAQPEPYEREIPGGVLSLKREVEYGYVPIVRFNYYAHLPPGTELGSLGQGEQLRVVYAYEPIPLSSHWVLVVSAALIGASILWAYKIKTGGNP